MAGLNLAIFPTALELAGTSITGTFADLGQFDGSTRKLFILSTCNQEIALNFDGTAASQMIIPGVGSLFGIPLDLDTSMHWAGKVAVKHTGVAPTSGKVIVFAVSIAA